MDIFSARLKWLREMKGYTQADIAEKLGMSRPGYTKIEQGTREPNLETLAKLPSILEESVDFLTGVTDYTRNAKVMHNHFNDASDTVAFLMHDIHILEMNPHDERVKSKDFNPDDPKSVGDKIARIRKNIPLWEERLEICREKLLAMLEDIPHVNESTISEVRDESGWLSLLDFDDLK